MNSRFLASLLAVTTLSSCTILLPIIGEERAVSATRSTGIKHESMLISNIAGGLALDLVAGIFLAAGVLASGTCLAPGCAVNPGGGGNFQPPINTR